MSTVIRTDWRWTLMPQTMPRLSTVDRRGAKLETGVQHGPRYASRIEIRCLVSTRDRDYSVVDRMMIRRTSILGANKDVPPNWDTGLRAGNCSRPLALQLAAAGRDATRYRCEIS